MSLEFAQDIIKKIIHENIEVYIFKDKPPFGNEVTFYFVNRNSDTKNPFFWNAKKCWDGSIAKSVSFYRMPSRTRRYNLLNKVFGYEPTLKIYNKLFE